MNEVAGNTRQDRIREFTERWKSVCEIAFTAVLLVFTILLWRANRDYSNTARQALRPWVGVFGTDPLRISLVANQPLDVGLRYQNFGNSPALRVATNYKLSVAETSPSQESQWTTHTAPTDPNCVSETEKKFGAPVFQQQGEEGFVQHMFPDERQSFSDIDVSAVLSHKKELYMTGCIVYRDGAGKNYHTNFCMVYAPQAGAMHNRFVFCPIGNLVE
jgi:hypothetical protein